MVVEGNILQMLDLNNVLDIHHNIIYITHLYLTLWLHSCDNNEMISIYNDQASDHNLVMCLNR